MTFSQSSGELNFIVLDVICIHLHKYKYEYEYVGGMYMCVDIINHTGIEYKRSRV